MAVVFTMSCFSTFYLILKSLERNFMLDCDSQVKLIITFFIPLVDAIHINTNENIKKLDQIEQISKLHKKMT